ncbi:MAG: amidohydrolase family protein [bacterium]|nr:amidohydrolase family protein [bacterium]
MLRPRDSRSVFRPAICALGLTILALAAGSILAAERPRVYAVHNATVVPTPGEAIESAVVVVRDGLIEAVGSGIEIPSDAVEIDAGGGWVYPGLIDAHGTLGVQEPRAAAAGGESPGATRGGGNPTPAGAVHPLKRIHAERRVRDALQSFEGTRADAIERHRDLGITVMLATPGSGILRGSSTAILLAEGVPVPALILREGVAQHAAFERGRFGEGYPTSLMGTVAALRQSFLDAERYANWSERYAADPRGMRRPEHHAAFEALGPVLRGDAPLFFEVDGPENALLAARLADEFELDVVIEGAGHEWEMANEIAATGRALILPVGFPDKPDVKEPHDALAVGRRALRRWVDAPQGALRLHEAGVRFALTTNGLKNTANFYKNLREIIAAGLPEEIALAALTSVPAELLGVSRSVGSIEPGKIANLIVADGPLFAEQTEIRRVFVDGIPHEREVKEKPQGDPDAVVDPRGEWSVVFEFGSRTIQRTWTISGERPEFGGTAETRGGTVTFDEVQLEGNVMTLIFPAREGRPSSEVTVVIEGESFTGTAEMGSRSIEVEGSRTSGPEGGTR